MRRDELRTLAERAYPGLEPSGLCKHHRASYPVDCVICYPDLNQINEGLMQSLGRLLSFVKDTEGLGDTVELYDAALDLISEVPDVESIHGIVEVTLRTARTGMPDLDGKLAEIRKKVEAKECEKNS